MRIAIAQTPGTRLADWPQTRALIEQSVRTAARQGAALVLLPECAWPAYVLDRAAAYFAARDAGMPSDQAFLRDACALAREAGVAVCVGYVEEQGPRLTNAAALIDTDGALLATYRKCFLWAFDNEYFAPGDCIEPVDTPFGRVGMMICADARLPEIAATLASRGAEFILQPTAWVNAGTPAAPWNPQPDFLIRARAAELGVPIASASKWGVEGQTTFVGSSMICDATGRVLVQSGRDETTVAVADVQPGVAAGPVVSDAERAVLCDTAAACPPVADAPPLTFQALPPGAPIVSSDWRGSRSAVGPDGGVALHKPMMGDAFPPVIDTPLPAPLALERARIGVLSADDAARFAACRCLALAGAHLVVVIGAGAPDAALRARACENRVYVVGVGRGGWCAIDPDGRVLDEGAWTGAPATLPPLALARAANKCVVPGTDMIGGRRVEQYTF